MSTTKPYSGTSKDRLVALINSDNGTNLQEGVDFVFGPVTSHSGKNGRNTRIKIIPIDTETYSERSVDYKRLSINVINNLPPGFIERVEINTLPFTTHSILEDINEALGLDLTEDEVVDELHETSSFEYPLKIRSTSLAWLASTYMFKVTIDGVLLQENGDPLLMENGFAFELESS